VRGQRADVAPSVCRADAPGAPRTRRPTSKICDRRLLRERIDDDLGRCRLQRCLVGEIEVRVVQFAPPETEPNPRCICRSLLPAVRPPHSRPASCTRCGPTRGTRAPAGAQLHVGRRTVTSRRSAAAAGDRRDPRPHTPPRRRCGRGRRRSRLPTERTWTAPTRTSISPRGIAAGATGKVVVDAAAHKAASQIFDVGGASVCARRICSTGHWRNIRTRPRTTPPPTSAGDRRLPRPGHPLPGRRYF